MSETFIVKDWFGNVLFGGRTFPTFEDGWSHIYQTRPEPEHWLDGWYDDFYVVYAEEES